VRRQQLRNAEQEATRQSETRRPGRGLGPFTGTQLTVLILALVLAVAFPVGAWAVSGSNIFVTDASTGVHAKVDGKNNVYTSLHDGTSGSSAKVDASGNLRTTVNGTVTVTGPVRSAPKAGDTFTQTAFAYTYLPTQSCIYVFKPKNDVVASVITSIEFVQVNGTGSWADTEVHAVTTPGALNTQCSQSPTVTAFVARAVLADHSQYTQTFPSGIGLAPGHGLYANSAGNSGITQVFVSGYYVNASECAAGCY
jgi:hypothetical protein